MTPNRKGWSLQVVDLIGGPGRDRTDDLFHAMEARSQLRHRPTWRQLNCRRSSGYPSMERLSNIRAIAFEKDSRPRQQSDPHCSGQLGNSGSGAPQSGAPQCPLSRLVTSPGQLSQQDTATDGPEGRDHQTHRRAYVPTQPQFIAG